MDGDDGVVHDGRRQGVAPPVLLPVRVSVRVPAPVRVTAAVLLKFTAPVPEASSVPPLAVIVNWRFVVFAPVPRPGRSAVEDQVRRGVARLADAAGLPAVGQGRDGQDAGADRGRSAIRVAGVAEDQRAAAGAQGPHGDRTVAPPSVIWPETFSVVDGDTFTTRLPLNSTGAEDRVRHEARPALSVGVTEPLLTKVNEPPAPGTNV